MLEKEGEGARSGTSPFFGFASSQKKSKVRRSSPSSRRSASGSKRIGGVEAGAGAGAAGAGGGARAARGSRRRGGGGAEAGAGGAGEEGGAGAGGACGEAGGGAAAGRHPGARRARSRRYRAGERIMPPRRPPEPGRGKTFFPSLSGRSASRGGTEQRPGQKPIFTPNCARRPSVTRQLGLPKFGFTSGSLEMKPSKHP